MTATAQSRRAERRIVRAGKLRAASIAQAESHLTEILDTLIDYPDAVSQRNAERLSGVNRSTFSRRLAARRQARGLGGDAA